MTARTNPPKTKFQSTPLCEGRRGYYYSTRKRRQNFNPRPYVRGDRRARRDCMPARNFNPRPYVRGDACRPISASSELNFNPRPYVRGDIPLLISVHNNNNFNPRPYVRGDICFHIFCSGTLLFQSTPLCEGRRKVRLKMAKKTSISIHAPM